MRLFVALVPPPIVVAALPHVPGGVRPVPRDQVHLTLAFLGDHPAHEPLVECLDAVVRGPAPVLQTIGAGAFGTAVWVGLGGDVERLAELATSVQAAVAEAGVDLEDRSWRPHLTVGRTRGRAVSRGHGRDLLEPTVLAALGDHAGPRAPWTEVRLVRSQLGRTGAHHETVAHWTLDAPAGA